MSIGNVSRLDPNDSVLHPENTVTCSHTLGNGFVVLLYAVFALVQKGSHEPSSSALVG